MAFPNTFCTHTFHSPHLALIGPSQHSIDTVTFNGSSSQNHLCPLTKMSWPFFLDKDPFKKLSLVVHSRILQTESQPLKSLSFKNSAKAEIESR